MSNYQKVIRGRDSLGKLREMADKTGIRKPMIIGTEPLIGTLMKKNPWLLSASVFSDFHANPDLADTKAGAALYMKANCDGLISVGGGSSIDTAKAIKARLDTADEEAVIGSKLEGRIQCPHIAIPGTAGTGSEATQTAVVYVNGRKVSLNHISLRPDGVILDASLLDSLPLYHKKSCALDALSQGIESYWSISSTDDSKVHAFLAIIGVLDNLKAYLAGDPHAAEEMLDASYQSGKAIQITRTTAAHAMSYMLTKKLGLAHGHACMITLPVLWEMMQEREDMQPVLQEFHSEVLRYLEYLTAVGVSIVFWGVLALVTANVTGNIWKGIGAGLVLWMDLISTFGSRILGRYNIFAYALGGTDRGLSGWIPGKTIGLIIAVVIGVFILPKTLGFRRN